MSKKLSDAVRVRGRDGLKAHLVGGHRREDCSRDPDAQLERGGWTRTMYARSHILAEVAWKYACPTCWATCIVVVE